MTISRRDFLHASAPAVGALLLSPRGARRPTATVPRRPLRILILGGTGFIGPHQVRLALARGHEVTLFNRGRTAPDLFPEVETLIGDRDGDLEALRGRTWDVAIDNSATLPRQRHVRGTEGTLRSGGAGRLPQRPPRDPPHLHRGSR